MIGEEILSRVLDACSEGILVVQLDHNDWPVILANEAFAALREVDPVGVPFADVIEGLTSREQALTISEALRARQETSMPLEVGGKDLLLSLKPLAADGDTRGGGHGDAHAEGSARYYVAIFRSSPDGRGSAGLEAQQELLRAKRQLRDLTREDIVTGLMNETAFREVFLHDWAVARRESSTLALVAFRLDDFDAYVEVFGRHAADSCLRRVGLSIRRCLRRASDVVARFGEASFVCMSHGTDEQAVREFAEQIARTVRELGLHHPRSSRSRWVTVSTEVAVNDSAYDERSAEEFLDELTGLAGPE